MDNICWHFTLSKEFSLVIYVGDRFNMHDTAKPETKAMHLWQWSCTMLDEWYMSKLLILALAEIFSYAAIFF